MEVFIQKPSIDRYLGIRVTKETDLEYKRENVEQTIKNLVMHSITKVKGENFESVYYTTIHLQEGDILIYEEDGRGYIKPMEPMTTLEEAIADLTVVKEL